MQNQINNNNIVKKFNLVELKLCFQKKNPSENEIAELTSFVQITTSKIDRLNIIKVAAFIILTQWSNKSQSVNRKVRSKFYCKKKKQGIKKCTGKELSNTISKLTKGLIDINVEKASKCKPTVHASSHHQHFESNSLKNVNKDTYILRWKAYLKITENIQVLQKRKIAFVFTTFSKYNKKNEMNRLKVQIPEHIKLNPTKYHFIHLFFEIFFWMLLKPPNIQKKKKDFSSKSFVLGSFHKKF